MHTTRLTFENSSDGRVFPDLPESGGIGVILLEHIFDFAHNVGLRAFLSMKSESSTSEPAHFLVQALASYDEGLVDVEGLEQLWKRSTERSRTIVNTSESLSPSIRARYGCTWVLCWIQSGHGCKEA